MTIKKGTFKVDTGNGFDEIMLKTTAEQVLMKNGENLDETFKSSNGQIGFNRLPYGLIEEWGYIDNVFPYAVVNLPVALRDNSYNVMLTVYQPADGYAQVKVSSVNNNNFVINASTNCALFWKVKGGI